MEGSKLLNIPLVVTEQVDRFPSFICDAWVVFKCEYYSSGTVLLNYVTVPEFPLSVGFGRFWEKNRGFGLGFFDKHIKLPVFIVTGRHEDVSAAKREILSDAVWSRQPPRRPGHQYQHGGWRLRAWVVISRQHRAGHRRPRERAVSRGWAGVRPKGMTNLGYTFSPITARPRDNGLCHCPVSKVGTTTLWSQWVVSHDFG